jgi:hypothetical protein
MEEIARHLQAPQNVKERVRILENETRKPDSLLEVGRASVETIDWLVLDAGSPKDARISVTIRNWA